jgi:hypothetical protein
MVTNFNCSKTDAYAIWTVSIEQEDALLRRALRLFGRMNRIKNSAMTTNLS